MIRRYLWPVVWRVVLGGIVISTDPGMVLLVLSDLPYVFLDLLGW